MPAIFAAISLLLTAVRWAAVAAIPIVLWNFHKELIEWGWGKFLTYLGQAGIPSTSLPDIQTWITNNHFWPVITAANEWIPLSEASYLLFLYSLLLATTVPLKMILRRIPGING